MAEKIGQILIRKGKINPAQLREALRTQQFFGGYLGSHLINLGFIDEATLGETLSEIYRVPFAPFDSIRLARSDVLAKIPSTLAQRFRLVPIQVEGNRLHVAMLNPHDAVALGEVASATGLSVTPWVAPEFRIIQALEKHYRLRKSGRKPIRVKDEDKLPVETAGEESDGPTPPPADYRRIDEGALGLDGHPLGAAVIPELGDTAALTSSNEPTPRSLQEWREGDGDEDGVVNLPAAGPGSGAAPPAPGLPRRIVSAGPPPSPTPRADRTATSDPIDDLDRRAVSGGILYPLPSREGSGPAGGRRAGAPPAVPRSPLEASGLDHLSEALVRASTRDEVACQVVLYMAGRFRRAAAFTVRQDRVRGWVGAGTGLDQERLEKWSGPLASSPFSALQTSTALHIGPRPPAASGDDVTALPGGGFPPAVLMIPIVLRERLVTILYADNEREPLGPIDPALWKRVGRIVEAALEIMILKNKMKQV